MGFMATRSDGGGAGPPLPMSVKRKSSRDENGTGERRSSPWFGMGKSRGASWVCKGYRQTPSVNHSCHLFSSSSSSSYHGGWAASGPTGRNDGARVMCHAGWRTLRSSQGRVWWSICRRHVWMLIGAVRILRHGRGNSRSVAIT